MNHAAHVGHVVSYRVTGMDCPSCVAKIENATRSAPGVKNIKVSLATQIMSVTVDDANSRLPQIESRIEGLGYRLARTDPKPDANDDDDFPKGHLTPAYRRALWIVVGLNVGYGLVEIVGGFVAGSQAVKADALDFLGDGFISFLGLMAFGWQTVWRARSALVQGYFLGTLGLGVVTYTVYRVLFLEMPQPELMGALGFVALIINILAALVLLPHRGGDANARAVWLFSRNDAIGNAAVVVAAGLVWWLASPWPDIVVAFVIAGVFLHSAYSIIRDASSELTHAES
jgi:Co/Zn/Cd efflux system component/copper chaperone CopZ